MAGRKYLVDTNIFVEILLKQNKEIACTQFITVHFSEIVISQFTLQSIALICNRNNSPGLFTKFLADVVEHIEVITLESASLKDIENIISSSKLDYDDAYQLKAAQLGNFEIVTMDRDFSTVASSHKILFI